MGVSLLRVSTGEVKKALAALPYVRSVDVYRVFPNTLEIELVEYEPLARVQASEGNVWLVSDDGRVLERVDASPRVQPAARHPRDGHHAEGRHAGSG